MRLDYIMFFLTSGGFSFVYKGVETESGDPIAIKVQSYYVTNHSCIFW